MQTFLLHLVRNMLNSVSCPVSGPGIYIRTVEVCYFRHIIPKPEDAQTAGAFEGLYKDDGSVVNTEAVLTTTVPL